jgi:hypothetical protein
VLNAEIKDDIEMKYGLLERANILWKALEQMYGSRNDMRSLSNVLENVSSSSIHTDQDHEEHSSVQREEVKSASLGKPDCLVSQTKTFGFGSIENCLAEEDDHSTTSSDVDNDDDEQELLVEFKKLISKHMKLQKRHGDLLCSHKELFDSYALLESAHEVMVTKVKDSQSHTCTCAQLSIDLSCTNSCCSQSNLSCDEHVLIKTCDSLITSENDELKRENEIIKIELS